MKKSPAQSKAAAVAVVVAIILLGSVCGMVRRASANPAHEKTAAAGVPPTEVAVDLSPSQLNSITIAPVATYRFPVELEAPGSISFDEDLAIVQTESTLVGAAANFDLTGKELARVRGLVGTNGVAERELEQAISDHQTAQAALEAARDAVRALGKTDAEIGHIIATGKMDTAPAMHHPAKWGLVNVAESDVPLLHVGQPVRVTLMARADRVFSGAVSRISATVDPNSHRAAVRCMVADPDDVLRPGMLADFVIRVQEPQETTAIPVDGVVREGDGTMTAWVTADRHHFVQRTVKTGLHRDGRVQILMGLRRGELAVTEGALFLDNLLQAPPGD